MLRSEYDLCLSKARASEMLKKIEKDLPDLKGIFTARGLGKTNKFGDKQTEKSREPNRRLVLDNVPTFKYNKDDLNNNDLDNNNNKDKEKENVTPVEVNYKKDPIDEYGPYFDDSGEWVYFYCKWHKATQDNGTKWYIAYNKSQKHYDLIDPRNRYSVVHADGSTGGSPTSEERQIALCKSQKQSKPDGYWNYGGAQIEYYNARDNADNIMLRKDDIVETFGNINNFYNKMPELIGSQFNGQTTPTVSIYTNGATITGKDGVPYTLKGWESNEQFSKQDYSNVTSTNLIPVVVRVYEGEKIGDETNDIFEIGYFGLNISKPLKRYKG
jgi:hypothetical protein